MSNVLEPIMATPYQIALITGASSGFGEAIAERLAARGMKLILLARRDDRLQALAQRLNVPCHVIAVDVRDQTALRAAIAAIPAEFAAVDVLVNNAGLALGLEPAHKADWNDWQQMIDTNCTALALLTRLLVPGMVERGRGHVLMMGSIAGSYAYPGGNAYGASKAFVDQFARNVRADLLGTGVRVTNIEPGLAETNFSRTRFKGDAAKAASVYAGTDPLTGDDIAEAVFWTATLPPHMNINTMEIMPTDQSFAGLQIHRRPVEGSKT